MRDGEGGLWRGHVRSLVVAAQCREPDTWPPVPVWALPGVPHEPSGDPSPSPGAAGSPLSTREGASQMPRCSPAGPASAQTEEEEAGGNGSATLDPLRVPSPDACAQRPRSALSLAPQGPERHQHQILSFLNDFLANRPHVPPGTWDVHVAQSPRRHLRLQGQRAQPCSAATATVRPWAFRIHTEPCPH